MSLTQKKQEQIVKMVVQGEAIEMAAASAGVARGTIELWKTRYPDFAERLRAALEGRANR